jgi:hypothetical protein
MLFRFISGRAVAVRCSAILIAFLLMLALPAWSTPLLSVSSSVPGIDGLGTENPFGITQSDQDSVTQSFVLLVQGTPPAGGKYFFEPIFGLQGISNEGLPPSIASIAGTATVRIETRGKSFTAYAGQDNPRVTGSPAAVFEFEFGVPQTVTVTLSTDARLVTFRANSPFMQGFTTRATFEGIYLNPGLNATYSLTPAEQVSGVPEPSGWLMSVTGLGLAWITLCRRGSVWGGASPNQKRLPKQPPFRLC